MIGALDRSISDRRNSHLRGTGEAKVVDGHGTSQRHVTVSLHYISRLVMKGNLSPRSPC